MPDQREDIKTENEKFKEEHSTKINEHCGELKDAYHSAFENVQCRTILDRWLNIETKIQNLKNLSGLPEKIQDIRSIRKITEDEFKNQAVLAGIHIDDANRHFSALYEKFENLIICLNQTTQEIYKVSKGILKEIEDCPCGEAENRSLHAKRFEKNVIELIEWLFIDEMEQTELSLIEDGSLRRDAGFKVLEGFDTKKHCDGFEFTSVIVECKNYAKPSYKDLMQLFTYTLPWTDSEILKNPLCLLVSRTNPFKDSVTWRIRESIFKKPMGADTRLILFLDIKDLLKMVRYREKGHPANIFKEKIQEFNQELIKNF